MSIQISYSCTREIMPHAENGSRDSGQWISSEMDGGQAAGESRVLHAHLDGNGSLFRHRQSKQAPEEIAQP